MTLKAQFNTSIDVSTIDAVRSRAQEGEVQVGELVDLLLRFALEKLSADAVREWAQKKGVQAGTRKPLKVNEQAVLRAFGSLPTKPGSEGAWRHPLGDVAAEAGLRLTDAYWALKALQARGTVHGMELEEVDRWGRPVRSFWALMSSLPAHQRPKRLNPAS